MADVLIFGGSGVLGAYVCAAFSRAGHDVLAVDLNPPEGFQQFLFSANEVNFVRGDITDRRLTREQIKTFEPSVTLNLAVLLPAHIQRNPEEALAVNVTGALNVLRASAEFDVRSSILLSSKAVYGPIEGRYGHPDFEPLPEVHPPQPRSLYERMKHLVEGFLMRERDEGYLGACAVRTATQWGPGKVVARHSRTVHAGMFEAAMTGERYVIEHGGDQATDLISYPQLANSLVCAAQSELFASPVYNVGEGSARTLKQFADGLRERFPHADLHVGAGLDYEGEGRQHYCRLDISRAQRDWSWSGPTAFGDQIDECAELWRDWGAADG